MNTRGNDRLIALMVLHGGDVVEKAISVLEPEMLSGLSLAVFNRCKELNYAGEPIDIVSINDRDLVLYVSSLLGEFAHLPSIDIDVAISMVISDYRKHQTALLGRDLQEIGNTPGAVNEALLLVDKYMLEIKLGDSTSETETIADIVDKASSEESYLEMDRSCLTTGWSHFDKKVICKPGDLIVLAGRPSMGKTDFALFMMLELAKRGTSCGMLSMEMRSKYLLKRLATSAGSGQGYDWYLSGCEKLSHLPIAINDTSSHSLVSLKQLMGEMCTSYGTRAFFIDYLSLLDPPKKENRTQEVSALSRGVKAIARDLDVPIMLISQLSRGVESRNDKCPQLSDLRDSGAIEQDADIVLFCYRPDYYDIKELPGIPDTSNYMEIISAKQRDGATGKLKFYYDKAMKKFGPWKN